MANSEDGQAVADDPHATQVNPETWRLVTITTADGDWQVQTLVQVAWIEENHVVSGRPIRLSDVVDVAEMGVDDSLYGTVVSVEACPAIEDGPGRVVLTTVSHGNDFVFDLTLTDASGERSGGADGRDHRRRFPVAVRDLVDDAYAPGGTAVRAGHVRLGVRFVDADDLVRRHVLQLIVPDVAAALTSGRSCSEAWIDFF